MTTKALGAVWKFLAAALAVVPALLLAQPASASMGQPSPWQLNFQDAASPIMEQIHGFHWWLLIISTLITLFVLVLLIIVFVRFNEKANPVPSTTTHHTMLEVAWTVIPVIILVAIAIPSFRLLFDQLTIPKADITVKATGTGAWTWKYEYPDHGNFEFISSLVQDKDLKPGQTRLLDVDNRVVVPVGATVRVLIAGTDVIHSWFVPSLGVQKYAMPGRLNETWFKAEKAGVFYGQCNQICGVNHGYMPIAVEAVDKATFERWVGEAKKRFADGGQAPLSVAEVQALAAPAVAQNVSK